MTRNRTYTLTALAVALYLFLCWAFADGMFTSTFWDSKSITGSSVWTYVLLIAILGAGYLQARRLSAEGVAIDTPVQPTTAGQVDDPAIWKTVLGNTYYAILWMPLRFFVGREWLEAGEHKLRSDAWMDGGVALKGYWTSATATDDSGSSNITYGWFHDFLSYMLRHEWYTWFAKLIAVGEFLVGLGLIVGALVGIAAFFGTVLNFNFQLAGSASTNPVLFALGVFIVLAWKVAGYWGIDRYLLPILGTPWSHFSNAPRTGQQAGPGRLAHT